MCNDTLCIVCERSKPIIIVISNVKVMCIINISYEKRILSYYYY